MAVTTTISHNGHQWWSRETRISVDICMSCLFMSRDCVSVRHIQLSLSCLFSVETLAFLAESRPLGASTRCLLTVKWLFLITVRWQCLRMKHFNSVSVSSQSNPWCLGSSHVLLPVSCNVSCLKHLNYVSVSSCLSLVLHISTRLVSWHLCLSKCCCLRKNVSSASLMVTVN